MATSRRAVLALLAGPLVVPARGVLAQRAAGPARIGWLTFAGQPDPALDGLRDGLRALGYAEGGDYVIVARYANNDLAQLPRLVDELAGERLDVLVARRPAADYTGGIRARVPVVFVHSGDPVAAGYATSMDKPGLNMTGVTFMSPRTAALRVDVLKEVVPTASRVAVLANPQHAGEPTELRATEDAARRLGIALTRHPVPSVPELAAALARIRDARPDAMLVFADPLTYVRRADIVEFAARERLPAMYGWTEFVEAGGLVSYGPRVADASRLLAPFVDRVLKGADVNAMPIEPVRQVELAVNLAVARSTGIAIPRAVVERADRVIG